ncbi:hypothetical protein CONLIGDRAFT_137196 [Coniochaeta ligniaria NRRL 30616]|uniref:Uncharacterized protein n=1 Tax=Coniochaeta ligniaria NRRL 30616 TaxID=1408157 RepID=A0A1J7J382_9PEZI|nr:hypothetical protein CONLIGDRAFT_137196 [Coniochaeta ligniaria NRRL 30616]
MVVYATGTDREHEPRHVHPLRAKITFLATFIFTLDDFLGNLPPSHLLSLVLLSQPKSKASDRQSGKEASGITHPSNDTVLCTFNHDSITDVRTSKLETSRGRDGWVTDCREPCPNGSDPRSKLRSGSRDTTSTLSLAFQRYPTHLFEDDKPLVPITPRSSTRDQGRFGRVDRVP